MKKLKKVFFTLIILGVVGCLHPIQAMANTVQVGTYDELMNALSWAQSHDVIEINGYIEIPFQTTLGYDDKIITLKKATAESSIFFSYNAEGSTVQNIEFDGAELDSSGAFVRLGCGVTMLNCQFKNNSTAGDGAGVCADDYVSTFNNCIFTNNKAYRGGCVAVGNGSTVFIECSFTGNQATSQGGTVANLSASATVTFKDCTMTGNSSDYGGAASTDGLIIFEGCRIYENTANLKGTDAYISEFGRLEIKNTLDDLKALYEADSKPLEGVYDEADKENLLDLTQTITGEKGIVFQLIVPEQDEPTEIPADTPTETLDSSSGSSGSNQPTTTYNNTYSPTINNVVEVPQKEAVKEKESVDSAASNTVKASATVKNDKDSKTYTATKDEAGNSTLEITEGENTITININVGTGETGETVKTESDAPTSTPQAVESDAGTETVYIQKAVNWLDVVQMVFLGLIALYLFRGKVLTRSDKE